MRFSSIIIIYIFLVIPGCTFFQSEVESRDITSINGIVYKTGATSPFNGVVVYLSSDGKISRKETFKSGLQNGIEYNYYDSKQIRSEETYKDGEQNGENIGYYENGQKWWEVNRVNGYNDGEESEWYIDGKLKGKYNYVNGDLNGMFTAYHPNGQIHVKTYYENGFIKKLEDIKSYWSNGKICEEIKKTGPNQFSINRYEPDGKISSRETYYYTFPINELTLIDEVKFRFTNTRGIDGLFLTIDCYNCHGQELSKTVENF